MRQGFQSLSDSATNQLAPTARTNYYRNRVPPPGCKPGTPPGDGFGDLDRNPGGKLSSTFSFPFRPDRTSVLSSTVIPVLIGIKAGLPSSPPGTKTPVSLCWRTIAAVGTTK